MIERERSRPKTARFSLTKTVATAQKNRMKKFFIVSLLQSSYRRRRSVNSAQKIFVTKVSNTMDDLKMKKEAEPNLLRNLWNT